MNFSGVAASLALLWSAALPAAAPADAAHPLLQLAREREQERDAITHDAYYATQLNRVEHEREQARPPADELCSGSMGAGRFAELHMNVGAAREGLGDIDGALAAYRSAMACRPRSLRGHLQLAKVLFGTRDADATRAVLEQALAIEPRNLEVNRRVASLEFVSGRWAEAMARFRYVAASDPVPESAAFAQLMFWMTQRRAGVREPEWVSRRLEDHWPRPLVLYARGEYDEAGLVGHIRTHEDESWGHDVVDSQLASALFLVGEALLARGEPGLARQYLAAVVNIRLIHTDEYQLAMWEIARLNQR